MALSNAEKQRRWREKQKAIQAGLISEPKKVEPLELDFLMDGFSKWIRDDHDRYEAINHLRQDLNGDVFGFLIEGDELPTDQIFAMNTIRSLEVAVRTLSSMLQEFRVEMIEREISRLEANVKFNPEEVDKATDAIVRLKMMLVGLSKNFRIECGDYSISELFPLLERRAKDNNAMLT